MFKDRPTWEQINRNSKGGLCTNFRATLAFEQHNVRLSAPPPFLSLLLQCCCNAMHVLDYHSGPIRGSLCAQSSRSELPHVLIFFWHGASTESGGCVGKPELLRLLARQRPGAVPDVRRQDGHGCLRLPGVRERLCVLRLWAGRGHLLVGLPMSAAPDAVERKKRARRSLGAYKSKVAR